MDNTGALSRECGPLYLMGVFRQSCCDVSCGGSCEVSTWGGGGGSLMGSTGALSRECGPVY